MKQDDVLKLIRSSALFDAEWYLRTYPDVALSGLSPAEHYRRFGRLLGRDPGPDFSSALYLHHNPDIAEKGHEALTHYENRGRKGNRRHFSSDAARPGEDPAVIASQIDRRRLKLAPAQARAEVLRILAERPQGPVRRRLDHFDADKVRRFVDGLMSLRAEELDARKIRASVIMPTYNRADTIAAAVRSVLEQSHHELELLLVDDGSTDDTMRVLDCFAGDPRLRVFHNPHLGVSAARNTGLEHATGDIVFYLDSDNVWTPDFVRLMVLAMQVSGAACASGAIRMEDAQGVLLGYRGEPFDRAQCLQGNYVDMNVFCHRRELVARHGGFDPLLKRTVDWDMILRYTHTETMIFCPIIGCHYLHDDGDASRISVTQPFIFRNLVQHKHQGGHASTAEAIATMKLCFAIRIAAPLAEREAWGDYHFAQSLQQALERLGHDARIEFRGEWDRKSSTHDNVAVVLRGLAGDRPRPGQLSLIWNISHPDQISHDEYDAYHGIFVASSSWAALLSQILGRPVETLLQCTDSSRFGFHQRPPAPNGPGLFVGNSRKTYRDILRWSVEAGLPVDVHGQDWEDYIPATMIRSQNVANTRLSALYASAAFVLNDHWASMRDFGFVSNRVFDVLGCGGRLVSDDLASIRGLFGDAVLTVRDQQDFAARVADGLPALPAPERRAAAQKILRHHTFDVRARQLVEWVQGYLSTDTRAPTGPAPAMVAENRLRIGLVVAKDGGQPSAPAFVRLLGPLTTDTANNRIDLRVLEADNPLLNGLDGVIVQDGALTQDAAQTLVARLAERGLPLFLDIPAQPGADDQARQVLAGAAQRIWSASSLIPGGLASEIIPDRIDPRYWRNYRKPRPPHFRKGKLRFLCTASSPAEIAPILGALTRLAAEHPNAFELILTAPFVTGIEQEWITHLPVTGANYARFARRLMAEPRLCAGLAPLPADNPGSGLAVLEYCALGALAIAQNGPGHDALIAEGLALGTDGSEQGWYDALARVIAAPVSFDRQRENAQNALWDGRGSLRDPSPMIDAIAQACAPNSRPATPPPAAIRGSLPGRDGWVFAPPPRNPSPNLEQEWHDILRGRALCAVQRGHRAYLGIFPEKAAIYPQFLPDHVEAPANETARAVLRASSGLMQSRLFTPDLRDAARLGPVFTPTEPLWTDRGALAAFDRMMADLGLPALSPDSYGFEGDGAVPGAERLALTQPRFRLAHSTGQRGHGNLRVFENSDRHLPRAVVFGDIFARRQTEMLASCFSRLTIVLGTAADFALITDAAPDFTLYLQSERNLTPPPQDGSPMPAQEALF